MKKLIFVLLFIFPFISKAQIVVYSNTFPSLGDQFEVAVTNFTPDSFPMELFNLSNPYFNVDISNIFIDSLRIEKLFSPDKVAGGEDITNAEMVFKTALGNTFALKSDSSLNMVGISPTILELPTILGFQFNKPIIHIKAPLQYLDVVTDSAKTSKNLGLISVQIQLKSTYEVNGYGKIKVKSGEYDVLRMRRMYDFRIKTIPIVGSPTEQRGSYVNWEFFSKTEKWPILRAATILDDIGTGQSDTVVRFEVLSKSFVSYPKEAVLNDQKTIFYAENSILFKGQNNILQVRIFDAKGALVLETTVKADGMVDISSLRNGFFIINALDEKGQYISSKFIKN